MLPHNAPPEFADRATLWNAVEKSERAKNAQLCREVRLALPHEFDFGKNILLIREYVQRNFTSSGMCADICIHDKGDKNIHAHILLTMRPLGLDGSFGAKSRMEYILDDNGERIKLPSGRYKTKKITTTDWDDRGNAELWRKNWADTLNKHLELHEQESRVDHRSYERQGLEILPTIHLGVVAHGLEKRGIATERGDINRAIKNKNAHLQLLDKKIFEIQNPPKPQLIIDIENSIKAKESPGYEHWARIFNLQQMAKTLLYIQENGYEDMKSLQTAQQNAANDVANIQKQLDEINEQKSDLATKKKFTEMYRNNKKIFNEYKAFFFKSSKNNFYEQHKTEIDNYLMARSYIFDEQGLEKIPSLKNISNNVKKLSKTEKVLKKDLFVAKEKASALKVANHNVQMLFGYRKLELQNPHPFVTIQNRAEIPVCKATFAEAKSEGKTELYFQNKHLNHECADSLKKTLLNNFAAPKDAQRNHVTIANAIVRIYGIDRAAWVLENPSAEKNDELRKVTNKVRAAVKNTVAENYWNNGQEKKLSWEDRKAVAQKKADEHNRNREMSTPHKTKKRHAHEMD
jgi:hypothetical protein